MRRLRLHLVLSCIRNKSGVWKFAVSSQCVVNGINDFFAVNFAFDAALNIQSDIVLLLGSFEFTLILRDNKKIF